VDSFQEQYKVVINNDPFYYESMNISILEETWLQMTESEKEILKCSEADYIAKLLSN